MTLTTEETARPASGVEMPPLFGSPELRARLWRAVGPVLGGAALDLADLATFGAFCSMPEEVSTKSSGAAWSNAWATAMA